MRRLLKKGYVDENQCDDTQGKGNDSFGIYVFNINIFHMPPNFLNLYAKIKAIIAEIMFPINKNLLSFGLFDQRGTITAVPIQAAERLTKSSESIWNQNGSIFPTKAILARSQNCVNEIYVWIGGREDEC